MRSLCRGGIEGPKRSSSLSFPLVLCSLLLVLPAALPAGAASLQGAFNDAGPAEGYDKLVLLDPEIVYTGGVVIADLDCAIRGSGALIDLQGKEIRVEGMNTRLDIEHCVITGGENGIHYNAPGFSGAVVGVVRNNTIYGNYDGIRAFYTGPDVVIVNNIIAGNAHYGIYSREYFSPTVLYNDVWGNPGGPYIKACG